MVECVPHSILVITIKSRAEDTLAKGCGKERLDAPAIDGVVITDEDMTGQSIAGDFL